MYAARASASQHTVHAMSPPPWPQYVRCLVRGVTEDQAPVYLRLRLRYCTDGYQYTSDYVFGTVRHGPVYLRLRLRYCTAGTGIPQATPSVTVRQGQVYLRLRLTVIYGRDRYTSGYALRYCMARDRYTSGYALR